ncbi:hypothetical protein [Sphingomonas sp. PR090111-T3T-6A]|uniref:hypothetical protein n=1 Tax=Sphingomonas sp. PR090111-T3T-6A TaxID=685778 RepID=UPI0012FCB256|nr:hypothetical protein [Sphingomonas sp. PR090111-T3T-6A]
MEKQVIFRQDQDVTPDDFNNMQAFTQASLDDVVRDAIGDGVGFAGFDAVRASPTRVTVGAGRLFSNGLVYVHGTSIDFDLTNALPMTGRKNVLVLVAGTTEEIDVEERDYLVDEKTMTAVGKPAAMTRSRTATVNVDAGIEAPDPVDPIFPAGYLAVARVVMSPTGIDTVVMVEENRQKSVKSVAADVANLKDATSSTTSKVAAIDGTVSGFAARLAGTVSQDALGRALVRLADVESKLNIPSTAASSAADYFLETTSSLLTDASSSCRVYEGVRFPDDAKDTGELTLANPLNPAVVLTNGLLLPAYDLVPLFTTGPKTGELSASSFSYQTTDMVQKMMTRERIRYGTPFTVCTNAGWWGAITSQYVPETFSHDGEQFQTLDVDWDGPTHGWVRVQEYWVDTYEEPYWTAVTTQHQVNGAQISETWVQPTDGWLGAVGLEFTKLATDGNVSIAIVECDRSGVPDQTAVISMTTFTKAQLATGANKLAIAPVWLSGGKRYAVIVITAAAHYLAVTQGTNFPGGTLFTRLDGAYQQEDGTKDLVFTPYMLKFKSARTVVDLGWKNVNALQLQGGIASIDILADTISPSGAELTYQVQIAGQWYPLDRNSQSILSAGGASPPLVPLQAVFSGTNDVQPGLKLAGSDCELTRPKLAFTHIWDTHTLPGAGSAQIRVIQRYEYFDPAHNTATVKLLTGPGYATQTAPNSYTDQIDPNDGAIVRTYIFNLGAAVTDFRLRTDGTTDAIGRPWHVAYTKFYAL